MVKFPDADNAQKYYYKGTLTKSDQLLRKKLDEIIVKDKNIKKTSK